MVFGWRDNNQQSLFSTLILDQPSRLKVVDEQRDDTLNVLSFHEALRKIRRCADSWQWLRFPMCL